MEKKLRFILLPLMALIVLMAPQGAFSLESQIIKFDGGKNSRLENYLIQPNEAQEADSVDVESGALKPLKGLGTYNYSAWTSGCAPNHDKNFWHGPRAIYKKRDGTWMQGVWDSTIAEWNDRYLRSFNDGSMRMMVEDLLGVKALVGITGPSTAITATAVEDRTWFAGIYPSNLQACDYPPYYFCSYFDATDDNGNGELEVSEIDSEYINDPDITNPLVVSYSVEGSGEGDEFTTGETIQWGDILYLGWKEKVGGFFADFTPGDGEWVYIYQYATEGGSVISGEGWKTLTVIEDTVNNFRAAEGTHWVTFEIPDDWVPSSQTNIYPIRCVMTNLSSLKTIPQIRRVWPAQSNIQEAKRAAQTGTGGERSYIFTWVYKTTTLTLESSPAPPGWEYDALKATVNNGSFSYIGLTIPTNTLYTRAGGEAGLNKHAANGMSLITDLDGGTTTYWEVPVTYVRIYRTRADTPTAYFELVELPLFEPGSPDEHAVYTGGILTGYHDTLSDQDILANDTIDHAIGNNPPYAYDGSHYGYPAYVYEHNGTYFMVFKSTNSEFNAQISKKLFWSKVGAPHYIPITNYIEFDSEIQGIGEVGPSLLVLTKRGPFQVPGTNSDSYYPLPIEAADHYDCANNATIAKGEGATFWASRSGVIMCNGMVAREIATNKLGSDIDFSSAIAGAFYNKQYIIWGSDNAVITDLRYADPRFFAVRGIAVESAYVSPSENILFVGTKAYDYDGDGTAEWVYDLSGAYVYPCGENESGIRIWANGNNLTYDYQTSAMFGGKLDEKKVFQWLEVSYSGNINVTLYLDDVAQTGWGAESLTGSGKEFIFFDQTNYIGQKAWIKFTGTGTVNEAVLKYDWLKDFADKKIWRGALVYHRTVVGDFGLYLDGTSNREWILSGVGQRHQVHFNANSQGNIPRAHWTSGDVIDIKWLSEPYDAWPDRELFDRVRITHSEDVTVELYLTDTEGTSNQEIFGGVDESGDTELVSTYDLEGDSVTDIFFPPNSRGMIPSVIWYDKSGGAAYADLVRKVEILHQPLDKFNFRYNPTRICFDWEGDGTAYVYGDGELYRTIPFGEKVFELPTGDTVGVGDDTPGWIWVPQDNTNPDQYCFELPAGVTGRVWQLLYLQEEPNSGWVHSVDFYPKDPLIGKLK